ncbi:DUF3784 domain-containing protein [Viridibacillus sp. NPDC093762]|uniref:DUF3784 domain-containing protein n=1 Tax=Viridibacillus sp. NPDC093762 TaxID=3390720 RepID=UPI003D075A9D
MEMLQVIIFSGFFVVLGIIIWKKKPLDFIAGYQKNQIFDAKKLARNIGLVVIFFGAEVAILMGLNLSITSIAPLSIAVLAMGHIILILLLFIYDRLQFQRQ